MVTVTPLFCVSATMVSIYNPKRRDMDIFYFDGAANVQKAGRVSRFPCTTTLYEGEHALAS